LFLKKKRFFYTLFSGPLGVLLNKDYKLCEKFDFGNNLEFFIFSVFTVMGIEGPKASLFVLVGGGGERAPVESKNLCTPHCFDSRIQKPMILGGGYPPTFGLSFEVQKSILSLLGIEPRLET